MRQRALPTNQIRKKDSMGKLEGKVAVITAATSGMALATAKLFVEEGAYVFITGRRDPELAAAVREIGRTSCRERVLACV